VIDLSNKINGYGTLNWTPPAGNWKLVRFGYSLLGITNNPDSTEATGLEVDKLDPVAIKTYFELESVAHYKLELGCNITGICTKLC
jgi:hypothetical protein